ncbi:MAG: amidohydrolase family protein, partial [Candidatus Neomarinimicrobiota bacterium]
MSSKLLIKNCHFYDNPAEDNLTDLLIVDGQIARICQTINDCDAPVVDAVGRVLAPGFIDIHIQGAGGADVMDSAEALTVISRTLARFGITGFLATTIVKPEIDNRHLAVIAQNVGKDLGGARILGIHLEGPFINPHKRGGIASSALCPPSFQMLNQILEMTNETLRMMTIAPELPGNHEIIQQLTKIGIVASFGHSAANYRETKDGLAAGISHVTHIFNAMPALHHREPGPVAAIFESETITAQIISDGIHLHPAIINLLWKNLGKNRCICISDGIQAIGLP